jgi:hypothetical protein
MLKRNPWRIHVACIAFVLAQYPVATSAQTKPRLPYINRGAYPFDYCNYNYDMTAHDAMVAAPQCRREPRVGG